MNPIIFPSPFDFDDVSTFFQEFINSNKPNKMFTYRYISDQLKWPVGYINDLIKRRKSLTCLRAIEFSNFANYDSLENEKLIFLSLKENLPTKIFQQYFSKNITSKIVRQRNIEKEFLDLIYNPNLLVVFEILKWSRGQLKLSQIAKISKTYNLSEKEVMAAIQVLCDRKIIEFDKNVNLSILKPHLHADEFGPEAPGAELHMSFAQSFMDYLKKPIGPSTFNTSLLELPRERFDEFADRIRALRSWFQIVSEEFSKKEKKSLYESLVFQMDLNLFPVIHKSSDEILPTKL